MKHQVERALSDFPRDPKENGRQLAALLETEPATVRECITEYLCNGAEETTARYVIGLLDRESNVLDILLDLSSTSIAQAQKIAKLVKQIVPRLDIDLAKALGKAGKEQSVRILRLLAELADSNRVLPQLMSVIRDKGPEARAQACRILAQHCQNDLFVERALSDPDATVRAGAIEGVGLRTRKSPPAILKTAMGDPDPHVRVHALLAAFRLGEAEAAGRLLLLAQDREAAIRSLAVWAMGEARHDCFLETITQLEQDPATEVRTSAQQAKQQIESQREPAVEANQETPSGASSCEEPALSSAIKIDVMRSRFSEQGEAELYVSLLAPSGSPIKPLSQDDFSVEIDGRPVMGLRWTAAGGERPLNVALVLEYSSNMPAMALIDVQAAASTAIRTKRENDQFAVFKFSVDVNKTPFSPDPKRLVALVLRPYAGARRSSRLHDALAEAARSLRETKGERAVIAVAQGADRGSELSFWKVLHLLNESNIAAFAVQYGQGGDERTLQELGANSGGRYFHCGKGKELIDCLRDIIVGLINSHQLRFSTEIRPEREIRLRVRTPLGMAEMLVPIPASSMARERKAS